MSEEKDLAYIAQLEKQLADINKKLKHAQDWSEFFRKRLYYFSELYQKFLAKFKEVKHENNQLRKKLYEQNPPSS